MKSLHRTSTAQESLNSSALNRRTLLGAALGVGGTALLAACGSQVRVRLLHLLLRVLLSLRRFGGFF